MDEIEKHYNKFNEEKRLTRRHGQVEFITSMKYIHKYLDIIKRDTKRQEADIKIMDIGAGTVDIVLRLQVKATMSQPLNM